MTLATPPFGKIVRVMSELSQGTCVSNSKTVPLTVLELLGFNPQKFRGHVTVPMSPCRRNFKGSCPDYPWKHSVRSFNRYGITAFNAQKFRGSRDPGHAPFWKKF